MNEIRLRGASEHNLRSVDLDLPRGQWIAVTGPSGSGKTSLVFDTLVREGRYRYLSALSPRARQFFGKLGRASAESLTGLPPAVAVGDRDVRASPRSTVGTLTGSLDLLRLLFARVGVDPSGDELTRSHFSFNHPDGACEACNGTGVEDEVSEDLLVADARKSLREGALRPTLKNGYTVYSQVTLEVMDTICRTHGFDVDTPWQDLSAAQRHVILYGTRAIEVPFGKHSIESRMKWAGITARPRETGYYRGLIPVIEETLGRNRNSNVLRFVRTVPCRTCGGARLARAGREARVGDWTLPRLAEVPARGMPEAIDGLPPSAVLDALAPELQRRIERMVQLGLGHLALGRESTTLSAGEAQRLRLASLLAAPLSGTLVALDEPTLGLHPSAQMGMRDVLDELRSAGNTLLVVEHDPDMVRCADHFVAIGPGAGPDGGRVVTSGAPPLDPLGATPRPKPSPRAARAILTLRGATLHNLREADFTVHLGTFQVVMGPSGAGKSSLVFGTLLPALEGSEGGPFAALEGAERHAVRAIDARPIGRTSRSTPATWSGLMDIVRKRFAATAGAVRREFGPGQFSFNGKAGRCASCEGLGTLRVGLHMLDDVELPCPTCGGARYAPETLEVRLRGHSVADVLALSVREACEYFIDDPSALAICRALDDLGLGYLPLGFPSNRLSRGEGQRVRLATLLADDRAEPTLIALDEPDRGLHPVDVERLLGCVDALVDAGHTVLAISHHRHLWAAADVRVEVVDGIAHDRAPWPTPAVAPRRGPRPPAAPPENLRLTGARTHNLRGVDVAFPRDRITAVCGVSGSGKSSLAFDTLAGEAWHRFAESLPFQVRRFTRRMPRPDLESAEGLGPVVALRQSRVARAGRRSTVATQTEIGPTLRLLWSRAGTLDGKPCRLSAEHFSPDRALGACPACEGAGVVLRGDPARLITHPERPITGGAMDGTRAGKYLGERHGQFVATLRAAGPDIDWERPWSKLSSEERALALDGGDGTTLSVRWELAGEQRSGEGKEAHEFETEWTGFLALAEREARRRARQKSAAQWADALADADCEACGGSRLGPQARVVEVGGLTLPGLFERRVDRLVAALESLELESRAAAVLAAVLPGLRERVGDLAALGLGHLALGRPSRTLSAGELQRVRLAGVLRSGLTGVTVVLDEPTSGLHPRDVDGLVALLRGFRERGNTVVVVEHDPRVLRAADHLLELGPGAGADGGRVIAAGEAATVLAGDGPTARALRATTGAPRDRPSTPERLVLRGCRAHNLMGIDVELPASGVVAVTGVSGSGKSSLVFDVLGASALARRPVQCDAFEVDGGPDRFRGVHAWRGSTRAGTVLTALDGMTALQRLFHGEAGSSGLPRAAFSYASPAGRCPECSGSGRERVSMDFMADLDLRCPACVGRRYRDEVLTVRWQGRNVAEVLDTPVRELAPLLPEGRLRAGLDALVRVGLDYLTPGRRVAELSGGEAQRVTLAAALSAAKSPSLHLLDEPASGLHEKDVARIVDVLRELGDRGDLVVLAEHRLSIIAGVDHVVDLGPESGDAGGRIVDAGPPASLRSGATADALAAWPAVRRGRPPKTAQCAPRSEA